MHITKEEENEITSIFINSKLTSSKSSKILLPFRRQCVACQFQTQVDDL